MHIPRMPRGHVDTPTLQAMSEGDAMRIVFLVSIGFDLSSNMFVPRMRNYRLRRRIADLDHRIFCQAPNTTSCPGYNPSCCHRAQPRQRPSAVGLGRHRPECWLPTQARGLMDGVDYRLFT